MDVQSTYALRQNKLFVGQKVDGEEYNAITQLVEDAAGLAFGKPVARGTGDQGCALLTAGNVANFLGISVRDVSVRPSAGDKYPQNGNATILTSGSVAVKIDGAVTRGAQARYDTATGNFTAAAAGGTVISLPAGWSFGETGANGDVVKLFHRA
jgi:hypothetical protein